MAIPVWPSSLPQELITDGYGQQAPNTIIATQMDVGPGKRRRRTSAGVQPVQGQIVVTEAQLDTLRTFFRTSLGDGALRFSWADPVSGSPVEMRFTEPPQWSARTSGIYTVSLALEILP